MWGCVCVRARARVGTSNPQVRAHPQPHQSQPLHPHPHPRPHFFGAFFHGLLGGVGCRLCLVGLLVLRFNSRVTRLCVCVCECECVCVCTCVCWGEGGGMGVVGVCVSVHTGTYACTLGGCVHACARVCTYLGCLLLVLLRNRGGGLGCYLVLLRLCAGAYVRACVGACVGLC